MHIDYFLGWPTQRRKKSKPSLHDVVFWHIVLAAESCKHSFVVEMQGANKAEEPVTRGLHETPQPKLSETNGGRYTSWVQPLGLGIGFLLLIC